MIPSRYVYPSPGFERYWNEGKGRQLLSELDKKPDQAQIEQRIPLLFEKDDLADHVITDFYQKKGFAIASALLEKVLEHGLQQTDDIPECVAQLITQMEKIPEWLDQDKLQQGVQFCQRSDVLGMIVLRNYSLMGGYESAAINKPLIFTEALKKGAAKRIAETTEFWVNITGTNALARNEIGFKHLVKVRLMHAYARVSIQNTKTWDSSDWGVPINNWDMLATNLGFSIIYLDGLRVLGITPTAEEEEGLFHFWKYVGYLLGIPSELIPESRKEAIAEIYKWTITQPPADKDTQALGKALMIEPMSANYLKYNWQRKLVVKVNLGYNNYFLGRQTCETIGLPYSVWRIYPALVKSMNQLKKMITSQNEKNRKHAAVRGRKQQEQIKDLLLLDHQSMAKP